jgi:hypothetical protein
MLDLSSMVVANSLFEQDGLQVPDEEPDDDGLGMFVLTGQRVGL